jgi:hypothetical protein
MEQHQVIEGHGSKAKYPIPDAPVLADKAHQVSPTSIHLIEEHVDSSPAHLSSTLSIAPHHSLKGIDAAVACSIQIGDD